MKAYASHATTGVLVDAVVFDLGGVLIDWNPRHLYRRLLRMELAGFGLPVRL
jgi:2-haloacid dehalogenase